MQKPAPLTSRPSAHGSSPASRHRTSQAVHHSLLAIELCWSIAPPGARQALGITHCWCHCEQLMVAATTILSHQGHAHTQDTSRRCFGHGGRGAPAQAGLALVPHSEQKPLRQTVSSSSHASSGQHASFLPPHSSGAPWQNPPMATRSSTQGESPARGTPDTSTLLLLTVLLCLDLHHHGKRTRRRKIVRQVEREQCRRAGAQSSADQHRQTQGRVGVGGQLEAEPHQGRRCC